MKAVLIDANSLSVRQLRKRMLRGLLTAIGVVALAVAGLAALDLRFSSRRPYVGPADTWPVAMWLACGAIGLGIAGIIRRLDRMGNTRAPRASTDDAPSPTDDPRRI